MLEVSALCAGYGKLPVIRDVSFRASAGEIVLVAGENGAGKTTLLKTLAGLIRPTGGQVRLDGREVGGWLPERLVAAGLRLVLEGHQVFPDLAVFDNIRLGALATRAPRRDFDRAVEEIHRVFPILREKARAPARNLSGGQQQMLALAQAFVARPKVLLCDEPSLGLATALMPPILAFLREWARSGTAVVIVEQHVELALDVADRCILVERGRIVSDTTAAAFRARPDRTA